MKARFDQCFSHLEEDEESAAECIHCLKKYGEQIFFDQAQGGLVMGREMYDDSYSGAMKTLTDILKIKTRADYESMDRKYNLTMY